MQLDDTHDIIHSLVFCLLYSFPSQSHRKNRIRKNSLRCFFMSDFKKSLRPKYCFVWLKPFCKIQSCVIPTYYEELAQKMLAKALSFTIILRSQGEVIAKINKYLIIFVISELCRSVN